MCSPPPSEILPYRFLFRGDAPDCVVCAAAVAISGAVRPLAKFIWTLAQNGNWQNSVGEENRRG